MTKQELIAKMRLNMILFGKVCMPTMYQVKSADFHYEIAEMLHNQDIQKFNIIAPRGHSKSSIVAGVFPLHHVVFDPGPKFIILVSRTFDHSVRLLQSIKDVLNYSIPFRQLFGYWGEHSARSWKEASVILKDGTMIMAKGTGQQVVGMKHGNQRPTLILLDDPEDMNNTKTEETMEFNLKWLLQSLVPALDPMRGRIGVIGTPQHQRCMVEILATMQGWVTKRYKAIQDDGSVLWPEWWSREKLEAEKRSLESINRISVFYREFQCQIVGDEDQLFKPEYFQYYRGHIEFNAAHDAFLHLTEINFIPCQFPVIKPVNIFMGIDPASSTRQTADYSTIVPVAVDLQGNRYVLPYFRGHVTPMTLATRALEFYDRFRPTKTRVESNGYQEMLREYLKSQRYIPGLEIKEIARSQKSVRLESMEPFFFQKKVWLQPDMEAMKDELMMYPRGAHDDLLDGLFYATKGTFLPYHGNDKKQEEKRGAFLGIDLVEDEGDEYMLA